VLSPRALSCPRRWLIAACGGVVLVLASMSMPRFVVPTEVQLPGSQPLEVTGLGSVGQCDNCHAGYAPAVEPGQGWRGSAMAHAARDPLFWATVAISEQDFPGAGDLCIRCHSPRGWMEGRSSPTDGSALTLADMDGVECDVCHSMTNPDLSEHLGVQNSPYLAHDGGTPPEGFYGSGMMVLSSGGVRYGPYATSAARHPFAQSRFHRSNELCGTCHDVSNPVVGDLAHNNGAQIPLAPGQFSGVLGSPVSTKAAFRNFPFQYGIVERTFSEHAASAFATLRVNQYATLPEELRDGAIEEAYQAALLANRGGDYADGTPRTFSCQTCHMRPTVGAGAKQNNSPIHRDLPLHDLTGGNYWLPQAITWLNAQGRLGVGGNLSALQLQALQEGAERARANLEQAASLSIDGDLLKVVNLTGHKLISGFPEGRRMWLNLIWYGSAGQVLREDGAYGSLSVQHRGQSVQVETLLDLGAPRAKVYEAHYGLTQEWAQQLLALGVPGTLPLEFDRTNGAVRYTLAQLASQAPGSAHESLHFVLANSVLDDDRIPPYGFARDEAARRNALPVPATQYGNPPSGGTYRYWDELQLQPPAGAVFARVRLRYQPTSWEYVQFLELANDGSVAHLAASGRALYDAWRATGMAAPHDMASAAWCGLRGTGEGLVLSSTVSGAGAPSECQKEARAGDLLRVELRASTPALQGAFGALVIQPYPSALPPVAIPGFGGLHVNDLSIALQFPALGTGGFAFALAVPPGLAGANARFQGLAITAAAANGLYAASDAHDLIFR
jgi:hypothetical protein